MAFLEIPIDELTVNRANDRHGELENETAAIAELFRLRETHMKKLAEDITNEMAIYDPPLVAFEKSGYLVFDGNRRITCLKLIRQPNRASTQALQTYFRSLQDDWAGPLPDSVTCQVESDREKIDSILFRRHTGTQGGVGQSGWDDRAKRNFIERSGRGGRINVADEVEALLAEEGRLPERNIPRSTMNRLFSSEPYRNRAGISVEGNKFQLTHEKGRALTALERIAEDLAERRIVLGDLWNNSAKLAYLNKLETDGVLPPENTRIETTVTPPSSSMRRAGRRGRPQARSTQTTFIPSDAPSIPWRGDQVRAHHIWMELQGLRMDLHPNAVAAMVRILLDLAVTGYVQARGLHCNDRLSSRVGAVARDLLTREIIDQHYHDELNRLREGDRLISINSLQRLLHSPDFVPVQSELEAYWVRLGRFLTATLTH